MEALLILTGDEYAEAFHELTGRYPKWVPSRGAYRDRLWVRYWRSA